MQITQIIADDPNDVATVHKYLKQVKKDRWIESNMWFAMAEYIRNLTNDEDILHEYSKIDPNYNRIRVHNYWIGLKGNPKFTLASLKELVKNDQINEIIKNDQNNEIIKKEIYEDKSYYKVKKTFEETHFKNMFPICFCTERKEILEKQSVNDFRATYRHMKYIDDDDTEKSFIKKWLEDRTMRFYTRIIFDPQNNDPKTYNLFTGFWMDTYIPQKDEDITIFLEYIECLMKDKSKRDYFFNWLSWILKNKQKSDIYVILTGKQGIGKDILSIIISKILTKYYVKEEKISELFRRFSNTRENKLFVVLDEVDGHESTQFNQQRLKSVVMNKTYKMKSKGVKEITINDYSNYMIQSNNPMLLEKSELRACTINCDYGLKNKDARFCNKLYELINNTDFIYAIYKWIITNENRDYLKSHLDDFINRDAILLDTPAEDKFMHHLYENVDVESDEMEYTANKFFELFQQYDPKSKITSTAFGIKLRAYNFIMKTRLTSAIHYYINREGLKKYLEENKYLDKTNIRIDRCTKKMTTSIQKYFANHIDSDDDIDDNFFYDDAKKVSEHTKTKVTNHNNRNKNVGIDNDYDDDDDDDDDDADDDGDDDDETK